MRFEFHPEARVEYLEAIAYYEERRAGLGGRFALEVEGVIQRVVEAPRRWRSVEGEIRRCLAQKFPYGVLYSIEADYILILAVMHHSRKDTGAIALDECDPMKRTASSLREEAARATD